jgi:uncharacterized protein
MLVDPSPVPPSHPLPEAPTAVAHRHAIIKQAAELLPAQGPITVFVHQNSLHAFEDLPFDEAIKKAERVFGCRAYWSEDRYRAELRRERIRFAELQAALADDLGDGGGTNVPPVGTR